MSKKQGLHGIKALLVMTVSGVAAALIAVSGLILIANSIGSSVVGGISGKTTEEQDGSWKPAPSMAKGALNLCQTLETSAQSGAFRSMGPQRIDSVDGYSDSNSEKESRSVVDNCTWEIYPPEGGRWIFSLEYEAFAGGSSEVLRVEDAKSKFTSIEDSLEKRFGSLISEESMSDMAEESYSVYGIPEENGEETLYVFLGRTRGGVFQINLKAPLDPSGNPVSENELRTLVRKTVPVIHSRLERILPE